MSTEPTPPARIIEAEPPLSPAAADRAGAIVLCRHGEPALSRKVKLSARQYRDWWALYEAGAIKPGQSPPRHLIEAASRAAVIYSSTRLRAINSAEALVAGRDFTRHDVFIEAPLPPPPWPDFIKLSPRAWGVVSRLFWWFGHHGHEESREEAQVRSAEAARRLHELALQGGDVLVVAHGFFNTMIGLELRRLGWRCVQGRGYRYWSTRYFKR